MRKDNKKNKKEDKNKKRLIIISILVLLVVIIIGFVLFSIKSNSKENKQRLDVHFDSVSNVTKVGSATDNGSGEYVPKILELDNTPGDKSDDKTVNFSVGLHSPGDRYQFQVKVVNEGSSPAKARLTVTPVTSSLSDYIAWNVTGIDIIEGEKIDAGDYKMVTISIEYKSNDSLLSNQDIEVNLSAVVTAEQTW